MKLYIYEHCPYCTKARIIFALKNIPVEIIILQNDDEATPINMVGSKQVPILEIKNGEYMKESLDIVKYIDNLEDDPILSEEKNPNLHSLLVELKDFLYPLTMPRWAKAQFSEFSTQKALEYFINKKEYQIGDFATHIKNTDFYLDQVKPILSKIAKLIHSEKSVNKELSYDDIELFAVLRALSIVRKLEFPNIMANYLGYFSGKTNVNLS